MTIREKVLTGVVVIGSLLLILAGIVLAHEHDARINAQANQAAQQKIADGLQKQFDQSKADIAKNNEDLKQQLAVIAAQRQVVPTPSQFVVDVSKLIPSLPQPLQVKDVPATATAPATQQIVAPKEDIAALQKYTLDCDEATAKLNACTLNTAALETQVTATQGQLAATAKERDGWKKAAGQGSFLSSVATGAKHSGCGGAGALAGYGAASHGTAASGAISGSLTWLGCELVFHRFGGKK